jgi:hypothetical protein
MNGIPQTVASVRFAGNRLLVDVKRPFEPTRLNALLNLERLHPLTLRTGDPILFELLDFCVALHALDRSVRRPINGWARHFIIHFPGRDIGLWRRNAPLIHEWLLALTGDIVEVIPTDRQEHGAHHDRPLTLPLAEPVDVVGLVSDGLDSLCGVDAAAREGSRRMALATVVTSGTRMRRIVQVIEYASRVTGYGVPHLCVSTKLYRKKKVKEKTQRSRTVLALVAGITSAAVLGASTVESFENGYGTLNLPIPDLQYGAMVTQVLQPRFLPLWDRISRAFFDQTIHVRYPNRYKTKAQMLAELSEDAVYLVRETSFSCDSEFRVPKGPVLHCGFCGSCRYRQLSIALCGRYIADAPYAWRRMAKKEPDALLRFLYHAELLESALAQPDPWAALLDLQPELYGVAEAEDLRAPAGMLEQWRADARDGTLQLLRQHVAEIAGWGIVDAAA